MACSGPDALTGDSGEELPLQLQQPRASLQFQLPLADPSQFNLMVGVDHDPVVHDAGFSASECLDYVGRSFPYCYDEHDGSDYILVGGFSAMDAGSVAVIAAADGTVSYTDDGHYDRCHADLATGKIDCDGHEMNANEVTVTHAGGYQTRYLHLMTDSVSVSVGDTVSAGTVLGRVGSSGKSSMPHLHFQLEDPDGVIIDPYAGPLSQEETWWCEQGDVDALPGGCGAP